MISIRECGVFGVKAHAYVNPVNCEGVSGAGLALEFARRYPAADKHYKSLCRKGHFRLGEPATFKDPSGDEIIFFPTKFRWRNQSDISWISAGLVNLRYTLEGKGFVDGLHYRVSCPLLGCGLGGLPSSDVRLLIFRHMRALQKVNFIITLNTDKQNTIIR